jgi:predicted transcriptional regulator
VGEWTAQVKPLFDSGMTVPQIAKELGKSRQGVRNVLNGKTATFKK